MDNGVKGETEIKDYNTLVTFRALKLKARLIMARLMRALKNSDKLITNNTRGQRREEWSENEKQQQRN